MDLDYCISHPRPYRLRSEERGLILANNFNSHLDTLAKDVGKLLIPTPLFFLLLPLPSSPYPVVYCYLGGGCYVEILYPSATPTVRAKSRFLCIRGDRAVHISSIGDPQAPPEFAC